MKIKETAREFKEFIMQGNILDMAIGIVVGNAFKAIVNSLVSDIIMPMLGIIGGKSVADWSIIINGSEIKYGMFFQNIIDFLIIALSMFIVIKTVITLSNLRKKKEEIIEEVEEKKSDEVVLLEEIRDLLKK